MNDYKKLVEAVSMGIIKTGNTYTNSFRVSQSIFKNEIANILKDNDKNEDKLYKDVMDYAQVYIIENLEFTKHGKDIFKINKLLLERE
ncbi:hypothetical protein [Priestia aryabhattai]|uniref:hypothetical protein n=1 Tax=Priestia aryabhattai TaxID=412384 RepID=UPI0015F5CD4B|nr:hypothetical protein [Priestia aryabhattai]